MKVIKLSTWADQNGYSYRGAYNRFTAIQSIQHSSQKHFLWAKAIQKPKYYYFFYSPPTNDN